MWEENGALSVTDVFKMTDPDWTGPYDRQSLFDSNTLEHEKKFFFAYSKCKKYSPLCLYITALFIY